MERKIGRSSARARPSASSPHGYQSTGLFACWRRYGLVSPARRFGMPAVSHGTGSALDRRSLRGLEPGHAEVRRLPRSHAGWHEGAAPARGYDGDPRRIPTELELQGQRRGGLLIAPVAPRDAELELCAGNDPFTRHGIGRALD